MSDGRCSSRSQQCSSTTTGLSARFTTIHGTTLSLGESGGTMSPRHAGHVGGARSSTLAATATASRTTPGAKLADTDGVPADKAQHGETLDVATFWPKFFFGPGKDLEATQEFDADAELARAQERRSQRLQEEATSLFGPLPPPASRFITDTKPLTWTPVYESRQKRRGSRRRKTRRSGATGNGDG